MQMKKHSEALDRLSLAAAKTIGYITVAPVVAFGVLTMLFLGAQKQFGNPTHCILALINLSLLPLLAYPIQLLIPKLRAGGRAVQRKMAFVSAVIGYTLGIISAALLHAPKGFWTLYIAYFSSGAVLSFINKALNIKASGHACGVAGPILLCAWYLGGMYFLLLLLIPIVFWARIRQGRHTLRELLLGASVSSVCTCATLLAAELAH